MENAKNMISSFETLEFYRGISDTDKIVSPIVHKTRMDRLPRNMSKHLHDEADRWFEQHFGIKYRSQALFVSSSWDTARNYASDDNHVVRIIPTTPYRFCWSPELADLIEYVATANTGQTISDFLSQNGYLDADLMAAHASGNEVMVHCREYIAFPVPRPNQLLERSSIILIK
ncbi:hypothetical protein [Janthinobacterium sp. BJB301]|uniref:hypothetical protein n=1 Tax=Janthinobacterium sp. BJB301 TaxID=1560195 RepID=UPI00117BBDDE|nr:hypothetical protein [Janthinobacterium sp. BJB301]